ncbi:dynamin family protein [Aspergillus mulundensis]|uniref:Interferon-induced GTP-binding protein Mx n=1 Tax=Aspergillus mulundensis TaxID=1810919 RepID=A0A3D8T2D7_9EURO|nr:Interferon-induced GTP-binding protein Mx [Aspergillus mulundensis]RDW92727.1 Interferon-induced GTP-binding protein Mx [Aspergillus mulundensis]
MNIESIQAATAFRHLRTSTSSQRLSQIEQIRAHGIGEVVALPQLAVCGDQSAGKSSVLEAITGIPFPQQDGLCTRFPTEITLRHSEATQSITIFASIRPHSVRSRKEKDYLASYQKTLGAISELPSIIADASKLMGIRGYGGQKNGPAFAADVLRIEITGPIGLQLSVVDLPGLISVVSEEQNENDVVMIHDMVTSYLQSSRTIILAVVQASNDFANQCIIRMARKHDPEGQRTVGIITKPDLINQGTESKIARIAKNLDTIKLKLGFFLLKNPSPMERKDCHSMTARSALEDRFFSRPSWAIHHLDKKRIGSESLRTFLQKLLDSHIEHELPKVRNEIKKRLDATEAELRSMGDARSTVGDIRSFLTSLSMAFYDMLQAALDGNYHTLRHDFFDSNQNARLRALVQQANTNFATFMRTQGARRVVREEPAETEEAEEAEEPDEDEDEQLEQVDDNLFPQIYVTQQEMMDWIKEVYSRTRGKELTGSCNSALLAELFQEQSRRWAHIAEGHILDVRALIFVWIEQAVRALVPEDGVRAEVGNMLYGWLDSAHKSAFEELGKLLQDERRHPLTYNHYYTDNVQKERQEGRRNKVRNLFTRELQKKWQGKLEILSKSDPVLEKFLSGVDRRIVVDMEYQACSEALTQLDAYYKVAMKTFVDNVARQVIERHLMGSFSEAFNPTSVARMSDDELLRIGSEPQHEADRRARLNNMAQALRQSLLVLQRPAS